MTGVEGFGLGACVLLQRDGDGEHSGGVPRSSWAASRITRPFGFDGYCGHYFSMSPNQELRWRPGAAGTGWTRQCPRIDSFFLFLLLWLFATRRLVAEGGKGKSESMCG